MPPFDWSLLALCVTAFLAGAMNSIAGGGTLLTFPALTSVVSPAFANGTSTIALMPGSFAGTLGYRKELWECRKFALRMLVPACSAATSGPTSSAAIRRRSRIWCRGSS
ncbi:MAG: TSUP family transporter [Gemmataceae bacterium]